VVNVKINTNTNTNVDGRASSESASALALPNFHGTLSLSDIPSDLRQGLDQTAHSEPIEKYNTLRLEGEQVLDSAGKGVTSLAEFQNSSVARDELSLAVRAHSKSDSNNSNSLVIDDPEQLRIRDKILEEISRSECSVGNVIDNFHKNGLIDQRLILEVAMACARKNAAATTIYFKSFGIKPGNEAAVVEIVSVCIADNFDKAMKYFHRFGIKSESQELIAQIVLRELKKKSDNRGWGKVIPLMENFWELRITNEKLIEEIVLECIELGETYEVAIRFERLGIAPESQGTIGKILLAMATKDTLGARVVASGFQIFGINPGNQELIAEIALACAHTEGGVTAECFQNFGIRSENQEVIAQIAMACVNKDRQRYLNTNIESIIREFKNYGLTDERLIVDVVSEWVKHGDGAKIVIENFKNLGLRPESEGSIVEIALACAKKDGEATAKNFQNFGIQVENQVIITKIAVACAKQNAKKTIEHFDKFQIKPENQKLIEQIAMICAEENGPITALDFQNFGIKPKNQKLIAKIALACAKQGGRNMAKHLGNFGLDSSNQAVINEIAVECAYSSSLRDLLQVAKVLKYSEFELLDLALATLDKKPSETDIDHAHRVSPYILNGAYHLREYYSKISKETFDSVPAFKLLRRLSGLKQASSNEAADSWRNELEPLFIVIHSDKSNFIDLSKESDCELFYQYIHRFGMINSPELLKVHVAVSKGDIPFELEELLGKGIRNVKSSKERLNRLKIYVDSLNNMLISNNPRDLTRLGENLKHSLARELFKAAIGNTQFERSHDPSHLVNTLLESVTQNPAAFKLREHERVREINIDRVAQNNNERSLKHQKDSEKKLLEQSEFREFREIVLNSFYSQGRINEVLEYPPRDQTTLFKRLEADRNLEEWILPILFRDAISRQGEGQGQYIEKFVQGRGDSTESVEAIHKWLFGYFDEHYLGLDRPSYLSDDLVAKVKDKLGIAERDSSILDRTVKNIESGRLFQKINLGKQETFKLVPTKLMGRVFSGDIGDACTTGQHYPLAKGKHECITSYVYVSGKGKDIKLEGSVLTVSTQTPDGRKVLHIRANNPRENLQNTLDTESLNREVITALTECAKEGGYDLVTLPFDRQGASCSNRGFVHSYYHANYNSAPKIELVNTPDTNFNGYGNWNPEGDFPSVIIWDRSKVDRA
jgi:hypothetical protein